MRRIVALLRISDLDKKLWAQKDGSRACLNRDRSQLQPNIPNRSKIPCLRLLSSVPVNDVAQPDGEVMNLNAHVLVQSFPSRQQHPFASVVGSTAPGRSELVGQSACVWCRRKLEPSPRFQPRLTF